jgi:hypothetical protein
MIDTLPALSLHDHSNMKRHDSGLDHTFLKDLERDATTMFHASNSSTTRHRRPKRPSLYVTGPNSTAVDHQRPSSEQPVPTIRPSPSTPRRSTTSTSSNSTNTRRRGHDSLPSSRRTSCTMVDPSRPARHYRIKSSQTCPTINRDIDDVLALHFRSCSLFQNPTYQSAAPSRALSGYGPSAHADFGSRPVPAPYVNDDAIPVSPLSKGSEDSIAPVDAPDTTMHWLSPSTRKTQYEKIDRANTGLRGMFRKVVPRCVSGPPTQTFYEHDNSDAGSVRRFRMDVSDDDEADEKNTAALRMQRRKLERLSSQKPETRKKLWGCF